MKYPGNIKKDYKPFVTYGSRGMDLENLINIANDNYIEKQIAIIYKKPTPIQVVKYNYESGRITDAFYKSISTLDYNGIYKGKYIEFDAKSTTKNYLPLSNIAKHQITHIDNIIKHGGICFLLIMIKGKCFILPGETLLEFIKLNERKSIPYEYIENNGIEVEINYLKGIDYIKGVDIMLKEKI